MCVFFVKSHYQYACHYRHKPGALVLWVEEPVGNLILVLDQYCRIEENVGQTCNFRFSSRHTNKKKRKQVKLIFIRYFCNKSLSSCGHLVLIAHAQSDRLQYKCSVATCGQWWPSQTPAPRNTWHPTSQSSLASQNRNPHHKSSPWFHSQLLRWSRTALWPAV